MNKETLQKIRRIGIIAVGVFIAVYMCYRVYIACVDKVQTQAAFETQQNNSLTLDGFILRSEEYVNVSDSKTVVSLVQDGVKVTTGSPVAMTFASEAQAADYELLNEVRSEMERYQKLASVSPTSNIDTKGLDTSIDRAVASLVDRIDGDRLDETEDGFSVLRSAIIKKQLMVGETISFGSILNALSAQEASLKKSISKSGTIQARHSGYYVGNTDGYEGVADYKTIEAMTPAEADKLFAQKAKPVEENCIGRIVTEFNWYIVSKVETKKIEKLKKGAHIRVAFRNTAEEIDGVVAAINVDGSGSAVVVLRCSRADNIFLNMRREEVEIIFNTVSGFRIPADAVREENGKKEFHHLNLQESSIMSSPYFFLRQNDVVYVEPNQIRTDNSKYNTNNAYKLTVVSTIVSAASIIASLVIALTVKK